MKGKGFLKVTGILMIIGAILGIIITLVAIGALLAAPASRVTAINGGLLTMAIVAAVFALLSSVLQFVAGVVGVKNCENPEKAGSCMRWGITVLVLSILGTGLSLVVGDRFNLLSFLIGLVLPVLYIYGAEMNKQSE